MLRLVAIWTVSTGAVALLLGAATPWPGPQKRVEGVGAVKSYNDGGSFGLSLNFADAGTQVFTGVVTDTFRISDGGFTDDSATTGSRVVNKVRGFNAFAAGATSLTITNSFVTAASQVVCTLITNDATAILKNVVPANGSFTVTLSAAATGTTKFAWLVVN